MTYFVNKPVLPIANQIRTTLACNCEPDAFTALNFTQFILGTENFPFSCKWTVPFVFSGTLKEATGIWIAKRN